MLFLIFLVVLILIGFCLFINNSVNENSKPVNLEDDYNRNQLKDYYKSQSSSTNTNLEEFTYEDLYRFNKIMVVPDDIFIKIQRANLKGKNSILVPKGTKAKLEAEYKEQLLLNQKISNVAELNNQGIALEKDGNIKEAISIYEENIATNDYPAHHSYKRLMVIYRRSKDYVNELRIINRAIDVFPGYEEYIKRRDRTLHLINK